MKKGLKVISVVEGAKGVLALVAGLGIHNMAPERISNLVNSLVLHLHLNPANQYSGIIFRELSSITYTQLTLIAIGALIYSVVRFVEAYGLWNEYSWVEWFSLFNSAIYMPFEIYELFVHANAIGFAAFLINIIIFIYLFFVIKGGRNKA